MYPNRRHTSAAQLAGITTRKQASDVCASYHLPAGGAAAAAKGIYYAFNGQQANASVAHLIVSLISCQRAGGVVSLAIRDRAGWQHAVSERPKHRPALTKP